MPRRLSLATAALLAALPALAGPALEGRCFVIPPGAPRSSGYTAFEAGPDGTIYAGAAYYDDGCALFALRPGQERFEQLAHVDRITGAPPRRGINAQGKIHARILLGADGTVYAATKRGREPDARKDGDADPALYEGGWLFGVDPATGAVTNFGIPVPGRGLMGGSIDRERGLLYYWADHSGELVRFDLQSGSAWTSAPIVAQPRYTAIDPKGNVYMTGRGTTFVRCRAGEKAAEAVPLRAPAEPAYAAPYTLAAAADGRELLGIPLAKGLIEHIDISNPKARYLALSYGPSPMPGGKPADDVHTAVVGPGGRLYYTVSSENVMYLGCYDPRARKVAWARPLAVAGDAADKLLYSQGSCFGPDGSLWVMFIYPLRAVRIDAAALAAADREAGP